MRETTVGCAAQRHPSYPLATTRHRKYCVHHKRSQHHLFVVCSVLDKTSDAPVPPSETSSFWPTRVRVQHDSFIRANRATIWQLMRDVTPEEQWGDLSVVLATLESIYGVEYQGLAAQLLTAFQEANLAPRVDTTTAAAALQQSQYETVTSTTQSNNSGRRGDVSKRQQQKEQQQYEHLGASVLGLNLDLLAGFRRSRRNSSSRGSSPEVTAEDDQSELETTPQQQQQQNPASDDISTSSTMNSASTKDHKAEGQQSEQQEVAAAAAVADALFMQLLLLLAQRAGFVPLTERDIQLSISLNTDYLWQLFVKENTTQLDADFIQQHEEDSSSSSSSSSSNGSSSAAAVKLPRKARSMLVLRRGYSSEKQRGRWLIQKLDYLQLLVVKRLLLGVTGLAAAAWTQVAAAVSPPRRTNKRRNMRQRRTNSTARMSEITSSSSSSDEADSQSSGPLREVGGTADKRAGSAISDDDKQQLKQTLLQTQHSQQQSQDQWQQHGDVQYSNRDQTQQMTGSAEGAVGRVSDKRPHITTTSSRRLKQRRQQQRPTTDAFGRVYYYQESEEEEKEEEEQTPGGAQSLPAASTSSSSNALSTQSSNQQEQQQQQLQAGSRKLQQKTQQQRRSLAARVVSGFNDRMLSVAHTLSDWGLIPRMDVIQLERFDEVFPLNEPARLKPLYIEKATLPDMMDPVIEPRLKWLGRKVISSRVLGDQPSTKPQNFLPSSTVLTAADGYSSSSIDSYDAWDTSDSSSSSGGGVMKPPDSSSSSVGFFDALLQPVEIVEPTFRQLLVVYRNKPKKDRWKELTDRIRGQRQPQTAGRRSPIQLQVYRNIPLPSWQVVFPDKLLQFRPLDLIRLDFFGLAGVGAALAQAKYSSIILQLFALFSLSVWGLRITLGFLRMGDRYKSIIAQLLADRTVAGGEGGLEYLATAAGLQQFKQAALVYVTLVGGNRAMTSEEVAMKIEELLEQRLKLQVCFNTDEALQELQRFGLLVTEQQQMKQQQQTARGPQKRVTSGGSRKNAGQTPSQHQNSVLQQQTSGQWSRQQQHTQLQTYRVLGSYEAQGVLQQYWAGLLRQRVSSILNDV